MESNSNDGPKYRKPKVDKELKGVKDASLGLSF